MKEKCKSSHHGADDAPKLANIDLKENGADAIRIELTALMREFFCAVSFDVDETPQYDMIRALFIESGLLIKNSAATPEISSVDQFIAPRLVLVRAGTLACFFESEISQSTQVFGNIAHRLSVYAKTGILNRVPFQSKGVISTQFIHTAYGWKMSVMAWDDEREGLTISESDVFAAIP